MLVLKSYLFIEIIFVNIFAQQIKKDLHYSTILATLHLSNFSLEFSVYEMLILRKYNIQFCQMENIVIVYPTPPVSHNRSRWMG